MLPIVPETATDPVMVAPLFREIRFIGRPSACQAGLMWRIKAEVETDDLEVTEQIRADVEAWGQLGVPRLSWFEEDLDSGAVQSMGSTGVKLFAARAPSAVPDAAAEAGYPPFPEGMILLVEVGSTAHGTGLPGGEDHDETAVVVETAEQVLGRGSGLANRMQRTRAEGERSGPGDTDRQVYSLRKFLALAASGNPSILLTLWAPVIETTPLGEQLIGLRDAFVSRHVLPRYRGYMQSQVRRMQGLKGSGHGRRGGGKREELIAAHGYDTKFAMHAARLGYQGIELVTTGGLALPVAGEPGDWLRALRRGEIPYDDWLVRVGDLDAQLSALSDNDRYPAGPDRGRIERFSVSAHRQAWGW